MQARAGAARWILQLARHIMHVNLRTRAAPLGSAHAVPRVSSLRTQPCSVSTGAPNFHGQCSTVCSNWKAFGPTADHADGDAEYYRVTNRLSQQHEWFAPRPETSDEDGMEPGSSGSSSQLLQDPRQRPEYGLSVKQIAALGLNGAQSRLPDPVSPSVECASSLLIIRLSSAVSLPSGDAVLQKLSAGREIQPGSVRIQHGQHGWRGEAIE